jgi:hypothetical protein
MKIIIIRKEIIMANPVFVNCPANTWMRVASNVTTGQVWKSDKSPNLYLQTYRMTGNAAPVNQSEGVPCFHSNVFEEISSSAEIDVYIYAVGVDGRVRVDI